MKNTPSKKKLAGFKFGREPSFSASRRTALAQGVEYELGIKSQGIRGSIRCVVERRGNEHQDWNG